MNTPISEVLFHDAQDLMPGGVNSPVRAFKSVGGTPRFMEHGEGAYLWDVDGNRYLDYVGSWGPLIHGHCPPFVVHAVQQQLVKGSSFGAPSSLEVDMARHLINGVPSLQMVRMVNSGTEAVMGALRVARGFTGRNRIIKFSGCYHGHADAMLVHAGSGALTLGVPDSAGVTPSQAAETVTANFNDFEGTQRLIETVGEELAAVIVEPLPANMGVVPPKPQFLKLLREATRSVGALLIFDEVMSGFRVRRGGYQELAGVVPDLTTLGKIIGGGFPVGAYGGRRDIMECVSPAGPVYQAGTLSGNPLAMAAGLSTLQALTPESYEYLEELGQVLERGLTAVIAQAGINARVQRLGSMWTLFFTRAPVTDYSSARSCDTKAYGRFFHSMLDQGFYLPPAQFESAFISLAHTKEDIEDTVAAAAVALRAQ